MLHIYCGDGKGKTTAAIGLAIRMSGYDKHILFAQFLKGSHTGELNTLEKIYNIEILRCNRQYGFFESMTDNDKDKITKNHNDNLEHIIKNANKYDMIILDEVLDAYNYNLADKSIIEKIVNTYTGELVITGRNPDEFFLKCADYVSEIRKQKHPYDKGIIARAGIEY